MLYWKWYTVIYLFENNKCKLIRMITYLYDIFVISYWTELYVQAYIVSILKLYKLQYIPIIMHMVHALLCFVVGTFQFTHMLQGYFTCTGAVIWLARHQWSNPEGYE